MKILNIVQGSDEWASIRSQYRPASEAPAMMGFSPHTSRSDLIKSRATGIKKEVSRYTEEVVFARGHAVEPAARAIAEELIGEELFPAVAVDDDGYLLASFDGITMLEDHGAEIKQWNEDKARHVNETQTVPAADYWQVVHQLAVNKDAQRWLYLITDGADRKAYCWIERDDEAIAKLYAGWRQLDADVAAYTPEPAKVEVIAEPVAGFGALSLLVEGRVIASNLSDFRAGAEAFISRLPKPVELQTDQDFANADAAVKACAEAEDRIKAARDAAMAQMADVDTVLRTADEVREAIRAARLALDRAVKAEKETRRAELVRTASDAVRLHYASIAKSLGEYAPGVPASVTADLGAAIKGLKSLASIKDKLDGAVAQMKIAASQDADRRREGIAVIEAHHEHANLLPDRVVLVGTKSTDDLRNLIAARVADHKAKEQARLDAERDRIRKEEAEKLRAEQEAEARRAPHTPESEAVPEVVAAAPRADQACTTTASDTATTSVSRIRSTQGARIKLGDINARIAPLSISADGLASLGFQPVAVEKAAKLYDESDFVGICNKLSALLQRAAAAQEAA